MKIAIASLSNRGFQPDTVKSLLELKCPYDKEIIIATQGYHIAENRNYITANALKAGCDFIFTVDDDMIFPPDTLERLLVHKKDIVGVPYHPRLEVGKETYKDLDKTHIITLKGEGKKELFECEAIGTGIMLINTKILYDIKQPFFAFESHETGFTIQGEDWYFCKKAREAGYKVWCDPKIKVGHLGVKIY